MRVAVICKRATRAHARRYRPYADRGRTWTRRCATAGAKGPRRQTARTTNHTASRHAPRRHNCTFRNGSATTTPRTASAQRNAPGRGAGFGTQRNPRNAHTHGHRCTEPSPRCNPCKTTGRPVCTRIITNNIQQRPGRGAQRNRRRATRRAGV